MLRGTLCVRKEHQVAFLNLLLAKESNFKGQLVKRGVKRPEVMCSFFFFFSLHLLCKYELIYLLKQQIHNYTQSALTDGVKEATGSKVICLRPCSLSCRQWAIAHPGESKSAALLLSPQCFGADSSFSHLDNWFSASSQNSSFHWHMAGIMPSTPHVNTSLKNNVNSLYVRLFQCIQMSIFHVWGHVSIIIHSGRTGNTQ